MKNIIEEENVGRICAYCNENKRALTREHIWPRCIIERAKHELRYSGKAQKIVRADLVIRDVCEVCNNEALSELDDYFCYLYDKYFSQEIHESQAITFSYEYGKLFRALLKIAFNSSRTTGRDEENMQKYASTIRSRESVPVGLFIKLVTIYPSVGRNGPLPARATRCGPFEISNRPRDGLTTRLVQINSYRFYLIVAENIGDKAKAVTYLANEGGAWLKHNGEAFIPQPTLNTLQAFAGIQHWRRS
jgi:hypothetical protein